MQPNATFEPAQSQDAWRGLAASVPVMIGFVPFALVLGAQAVQKGLSPLAVPLMTGLNFGGGSEFAAVELWTSPPHVLLLVAITFLINSRHILMGATLAPLLRHLPKRKVFPALFVTIQLKFLQKVLDRFFVKISPSPVTVGISL